MDRRVTCLVALVACLLTSAIHRADAQSALSGDQIRISRAAGAIAIDGDLSDEGWRNATRVEKWYETQPGDNVEPKVRSVGYLTYDDRFLYAGVRVRRSESRRRSARRSRIATISATASTTSAASSSTRATAVGPPSCSSSRRATSRPTRSSTMPRDEDASPDFFWESATKITDHGWTLEMRIPFSSLRYKNGDPQTWAILLYRNYPRDRHYQFFSAKDAARRQLLRLPRNTLDGLQQLPPAATSSRRRTSAAVADAHPRDASRLAAGRATARSRTSASTSSSRRIPTPRST